MIINVEGFGSIIVEEGDDFDSDTVVQEIKELMDKQFAERERKKRIAKVKKDKKREETPLKILKAVESLPEAFKAATKNMPSSAITVDKPKPAKYLTLVKVERGADGRLSKGTRIEVER